MTTAPLFHGRGRIAVLALVLSALPQAGLSQSVRSKEEVARIVGVENLKISEDGTVSGEVRNRSSNTIRDVQLLVRYTWLWENETKPGKDDPSTSTYYTLPGEIAPNGRSPFTHKPSPALSRMPGGRYETSVSVGGFTEVIPQSR